MIIITTVILANQSQFNSTIFLSDLAYDVALTIRQAQVFGLTVKEFAGPPTSFDIGYGVFFDEGDASGYTFFSDKDRDHQYIPGNDTTIQDFSFTQRNRLNLIDRFCATPPGVGAVEVCAYPIAGDSRTDEISELNIVFDRPDPDAIIRDENNVIEYGSARIVIISARTGAERQILIESTGQISVQNTTP